jgi:hypothetical protein
LVRVRSEILPPSLFEAPSMLIVLSIRLIKFSMPCLLIYASNYYLILMTIALYQCEVDFFMSFD